MIRKMLYDILYVHANAGADAGDMTIAHEMDIHPGELKNDSTYGIQIDIMLIAVTY